MPYRTASQRAVTPQNRGRYPGFDVLDNVDPWDDVTVGVVLARLALPGELAFFTPHQAGIAAPLLDLLLPQDTDPRVPVLALIDARLAAGETDGWHYDEMPEDARAWRDTLRALDEEAAQHFPGGDGFARLRSDEQAVPIQTRPRPRHPRPNLAQRPRRPRVQSVDPLRLYRVLLPPVGLERDRVPARRIRAGISTPVSTRASTGRSPTATPQTPTSIRSRSPTGSRRAAASATGSFDESTRVRSNYRDIRARNDSAWLIPNDGSRTNHRLRADMRRYGDDEVDLVVVGAGAGGSVLTQRLARAGWRVVCLDAGPFWDPDTDWVSDERGSHTLYKPSGHQGMSVHSTAARSNQAHRPLDRTVLDRSATQTRG